jgi:hypothetical protein
MLTYGHRPDSCKNVRKVIEADVKRIARSVLPTDGIYDLSSLKPPSSPPVQDLADRLEKLCHFVRLPDKFSCTSFN